MLDQVETGQRSRLRVLRLEAIARAHTTREKKPFKISVRKLKGLGLTESLETGYRLSRRGRALLDGWR